MYKKEREPVPYSRDDILNKSLEVLPQHKTGEDFRLYAKQIKKEDKAERKELIKLSEKPLMKQRIMHLYVSGLYTTRQIARIMGTTPGTVLKILKQPDIQEMIATYQEEEKELIDQAIRSLRIKAVETQAELLDCDNEVVRHNVAKDILDRTGHKGVEKKEVNINMTYEERLGNLIEGINIQDVQYTIDGEEETNNSEGAVNNGD